MRFPDQEIFSEIVRFIQHYQFTVEKTKMVAVDPDKRYVWYEAAPSPLTKIYLCYGMKHEPFSPLTKIETLEEFQWKLFCLIKRKGALRG